MITIRSIFGLALTAALITGGCKDDKAKATQSSDLPTAAPSDTAGEPKATPPATDFDGGPKPADAKHTTDFEIPSIVIQ